MIVKNRLVFVFLVIIIIYANACVLIAANVDGNKENVKNISLSDGNNIRNLPVSAEIFIEKVKNGDRLSFTKDKPNGWNNSKSLDSLLGLVYCDVLNKDIVEKLNQTKIGFKKVDGWIKSEKLSLREGPSREYKLIDTLVLGDKVLLLDKVIGSNNEKWYNIETSSKKKGWVFSSYVNRKKVSKSLTSISKKGAKTGNAIVATAKGLLGKPYSDYGPDGELYVSDPLSSTVSRYDRNTNLYSSKILSGEEEPLQGPRNLVFTLSTNSSPL